MQIGVVDPFCVKHTYPSRQSLSVAQLRMHPEAFLPIASFTQMVPAGHAFDVPMLHARLHEPPGA
jgi:hypothetical protein